MRIWIISQRVNIGYDTYDSAVVIAPDEESARRMHPGGATGAWWERGATYGSWCDRLEDVSVQGIGNADPNSAPGVVLASFNAG